ncbi:SUMF1/EgtB/PvdO family nonheme iron enzyme, partial [bacterium]|nr:SUMF1/EgtB/PvdO family nonheme iron enzyme [bacterium]
MGNRTILSTLIVALLLGSVIVYANVELTIQMPTDIYWPGVRCWMEVQLTNNSHEALDMAQLFLALNVGTNDYWFYPSWVQFPGGVDWIWLDLPGNIERTYIILPEFTWPTGTGTFYNAKFLSVIVDDEEIKSNMDEFNFGWQEFPEQTPTPVYIEGFSYIPSGNFMMGSPQQEACRETFEDIHEVFITEGFYAKKHEVTQEEWLVFFENIDLSWKHERWPMYGMTWFDAVAYCNHLSIVSGLTPSYYRDPQFAQVFFDDPPIVIGPVYWNQNANGFRLPTESEWEY